MSVGGATLGRYDDNASGRLLRDKADPDGRRPVGQTGPDFKSCGDELLPAALWG
jgi:hypothetical protein